MTPRWYSIDSCLLKFVNEGHHMKPQITYEVGISLPFISMVVTSTWFWGSPHTPCQTGVDHISYTWQTWCHRRVYVKFNWNLLFLTEFLNILIANLIELNLYTTSDIAKTYIFSNIWLRTDWSNQLIYILTCLPSRKRLIMTLLGLQEKSTSFPGAHWNVIIVGMYG